MALNHKIREEYHLILSEYKSLLRRKQQNYKNEKLNQLSNNDINSQIFWKTFQTLPDSDTESENVLPPIDERDWLCHFAKLHSAPKTDFCGERPSGKDLATMSWP